jgi:FAD/FMN-containing dehydrogenase
VSTMRSFTHFDTKLGILRCLAGTTLDEILKLIVPKGWFLPVVPGTRFVTLGGAVANDIHGKNHHCAGTFGCHVRSIDLVRSDGAHIHCSPIENVEMFSATIGGMGLTGIITEVELQLKPIHSTNMDVEKIPFSSLQRFIELSDESDSFEYSVAWFDFISGRRGIFFRANHSSNGELLATRNGKQALRVPFEAPAFLLNKRNIGLFNLAYYGMQKLTSGRGHSHYSPFFFPLDGIAGWNLLYGKGGLMQYQCVVPESEARAFEELLKVIAQNGHGSFLGVLKKFGSIKSPGMLSFPRPGYTLALDFPFQGEKTLALFDSLDHIVKSAGGALYPAKDSRMSKEVFQLSFPRLQEFLQYKDPNLSSGFWRRVQ